MKTRIRLILILIYFAAFASAARADAMLTFTSPTLTTAPGGTVEFDGTLTNTGEVEIYLNSDSFILMYPGLSVDDSPFLFDSPLFLLPGDSYSGPFIDVTADAGMSPGSYEGMFTIQGGPDPDSFDDLASEDFTLEVESTSATPEPSSILLFGAGLAMLVSLHESAKTLLTK